MSGLGLGIVLELFLDRLTDQLSPGQAAGVIGVMALGFVIGWLRRRLAQAERRARGQA